MRPLRDAASLSFNLPDYRVTGAVNLPDGGRRIEVESTDPPGCPDCGVIAERVHSRRRQRLRDIPLAGRVEVVWVKRRWFSDEALCARGSFAEWTGQVPRRARSTSRLRAALVAAVIDSGRAASETARAHSVSWWLVQAALLTAVVLLPDVDTLPVARIGIDEHRYRPVRFFREPSGGWRRFEPWMSMIVNIDTGQLLGVVAGRDSSAIGAWLADRSPAWRDRIEVVAIDPSAAFHTQLRLAERSHPPSRGLWSGVVVCATDLPGVGRDYVSSGSKAASLGVDVADQRAVAARPRRRCEGFAALRRRGTSSS